MNYLEIAGSLIGLVYLYLEYRASAWLWAASIAMPAIYLVVYYQAGLYADLGISIYYILASVYGIICWMKGSAEASVTTLGISHTPWRLWGYLTLVWFILFVIIGLILSRLTDSTVPWPDAFTTSLSIIAMWMLAHKYLEQWIVWIVVDVASAMLYVYKELWFTGGLYLLYAIIAVFGYRKWRRSIYNVNE